MIQVFTEADECPDSVNEFQMGKASQQFSPSHSFFPLLAFVLFLELLYYLCNSDMSSSLGFSFSVYSGSDPAQHLSRWFNLSTWVAPMVSMVHSQPLKVNWVCRNLVEPEPQRLPQGLDKVNGMTDIIVSFHLSYILKCLNVLLILAIYELCSSGDLKLKNMCTAVYFCILIICRSQPLKVMLYDKLSPTQVPQGLIFQQETLLIP